MILTREVGMNRKYQNKYRIESARAEWWDYSSTGCYFITICTKNKEHFFGEVVWGKMFLMEIGEIVEEEWLKTVKIRPDMNLQLGAFVVMPNHFHGIIHIGENKYNTGRDAMHRVSTSNKFGPQSKNLASIMRGFKSSVTMKSRKLNPNFTWQPRFWDHIIRDNKSYKRIEEYIYNNPQKWNIDRFCK